MLKTALRTGLKNGLKLALILAAFGAYEPAAKAESLICRHVFSNRPITPYPLRDDFAHNSRYTRALDSTADIKDQCALGTCHLHAWATQIEQDRFTRSGQSTPVSTRYLSAMRIYQIAMDTLQTNSTTETLQTGANPLVSISMIRNSGLIPDSVWQPRTDFDKGAGAKQIITLLENVIHRAKFKRDSVTGRLSKEALAEAAQSIQDIFTEFVGQPPAEFEYRGEKYNPMTYAQKFYPEIWQPLTLMSIADSDTGPTIVATNYPELKVIDTPIDVVENAIRYLVDSGHSVFLSYQHVGTFVDGATGIMSLDAWGIPAAAYPLPRGQRSVMAGGGHAVQIVGYDIDKATGKVIKWKIHNSWGTSAGERGYFHMYEDYFRAFAMNITYYTNPGVTLPAPQFVAPVQPGLPFQGFLPR